MKIAMIAAMAGDRIIGANNKMPWHLPADLKHFKACTLGKPVVMGRKTYESIGKALPGRPNIVVTGQADYQLDDASVVTSLEEALDEAAHQAGDAEEIMIIGGGTLYEALMDRADTLYLTFIDADFDGDTRFPDFTERGQWQEVACETHDADDKNPYPYQFVTLTRGQV